MTAPASPGKIFEDHLRAHLRALRHGPGATGRARPILWGITGSGAFVGGMTLAAFLAQAGRILADSGRVYRWEDTIVFEFREPEDQQLLLLGARGKAQPHAASVLSNLFGVGVQGKDEATENLMPAKLVNALLADQDLWGRLPLIKTHARRAVFDEDFTLRGPGWHAGPGILVHGPDIVPAQLPPPPADGPGRDRLPPYLTRLFRDFCWASEADLENALALLLTGLLSNHFVGDPKPMGLIDGNQQEIGKTLLCQVIGQVLDGHEPERIPLARDEELEKKVGAKLRESRSSIFFFDNVKMKIDSAFVEANAHSPLLSVRLLGHSRNIARPNTYLWLITSNLTSGSSDTITRGVPIRLRFEGNPVERTFHENLLAYATRHRLDILGELAAMVLRWNQLGRPGARDVWPAGRHAPRHRCERWAEVVGGILATNGFTDFLGNVEEARAAMDEGLQALATLAEHVGGGGLPGFVNPPPNDPERGKLPREWTTVFTAARVCQDKLADKNARGRDTWVGTFLSGKTDRSVSVTVGQQSGTAVLRRNPVRNDQRRYYFEIAPASPPPAPPALPSGPPAGDLGSTAVAPVNTVTAPAAPPPTPAGPVTGDAPPGPMEGDPPAEGTAAGVGETGNDLQWC
jgi:hypothetical protein